MRDYFILIAILEKYFLKKKAQENDKIVTIYKKIIVHITFLQDYWQLFEIAKD